MTEPQKTLSNDEIPFTVDAAVWAREFVKAVQVNGQIPLDEGAMLAWFANAIMAGYDTRDRRGPSELSASEACVLLMAELTARVEPITLSSQHDAGEPARIVDAFWRRHNLRDLREDWPTRVITLTDAEMARR